ncbi:MAG: hypothetical protein EOM90_14155 [Alphaproteobacteria bacterium]|nr:hypothetical protein [Alphaproteobacteria bacterium]
MQIPATGHAYRFKVKAMRVFTLLLLGIFLYANTGFTVVRHICNVDPFDQVMIFNEYTTEASSGCCCCSGAVQISDGDGHASPYLMPAPCCKEFYSYLKADLTSLPSTKIRDFLYPALTPDFPMLCIEELVSEPPVIRPVPVANPVPPPGGKTLIYYLHQVKIPYHFS